MSQTLEGEPFQTAARQPAVTIVLATYNRPRALRLAIESVTGQTRADWQLLVIGDCCDAPTGAAVAEFGDPRIRYINLPERCGEQSGPNSVGMALADTPFVALMNHDDFWLPEHLEVGLNRLQASGGDFYAARAVFAHDAHGEDGGMTLSNVTPVNRSFRRAFYHAPSYFEPTSAWILRREACDRIGPWRSPQELFRTPLVDWVLRAWRAGLRLVKDPRVTVLKPRLLFQAPRDKPAYEGHPALMDDLATSLRDDLPGLRRRIEDACRRSMRQGDDPFFRYAKAGGGPLQGRGYWLNPVTAAFFGLTGIDMMDRLCRHLGLKRGFILRGALNRRTGEALGPRPGLDGLLVSARCQLEAEASGECSAVRQGAERRDA